MAARTVSYVSSTPRLAQRSVARKLWEAACAMVRVRSTRQMLAEMEPRMLSDIGVSRSEAHRESARPFWDFDSRR